MNTITKNGLLLSGCALLLAGTLSAGAVIFGAKNEGQLKGAGFASPTTNQLVADGTAPPPPVKKPGTSLAVS